MIQAQRVARLHHRLARTVAAVLFMACAHFTAASAQSAARLDALLAADSVAAASLAADALVGDALLPAAQRANVAALFGRFTAVHDEASSRELGAGTSAAITRLAAGAVPDALEAMETSLARRPGRSSALRAITEFGFAMRGTGAALRATTDDPAMMLLVCMAARDTAGARDAIAVIDGARARLTLRNLPPPLLLAEAELFLGDSSAALARLMAFDASWTRMERTVSWGATQNGWLLGRTWLLFGDVAIAMGRPSEAARAFTRVIALWENGDADVQPAVTRARSGLAAARETARPAAVASGSAPSTLPAAAGSARVRYDAVLWMQPRVGSADASSRPLAKLSFVATESGSRSAGGYSAMQTYDSVSVDMPLLAALGDDGLAIRRQIQASAGAMTATTESDSLGKVTRRSLHTDAMLPEELRNLLERGVGFGPLSMALPLAARAVSVGDEWTDSITLAIPGTAATAGLPLLATYRLTRITNQGGRRLAFISIDAGTPASVVLAGGDGVRARLTGEVVRDLESNETIRVAASLRATVTPANGTPMPVRVLLTALREGGAQPTTLALR